MAFAFVQTSNATTGSATSLLATFSSGTVVGDIVIVNFRISNFNTPSSVTDSKGNTYAKAAGPINIAASSEPYYQYYGVQVTGGTTTVTITLSGTDGIHMIIDEFSGNASTNATAFDTASTHTSAGSSATSSAVTSFSPASAGELIAVGVGFNSTAFGTFTAGTGYTTANTAETASRSMYRLSSTTTETAPCSWTSAVGIAEIAGAYIPSGGVAPTISYIPYLPPFFS